MKHKIISKFLFLICVALPFWGSKPAIAANCGVAEKISVGNGKTGVVIDSAWSGADVSFDALSSGSHIYFAYYNANRWLTVAQLDSKTNTVCLRQLNSRFAGWDSHKYVTLASDSIGRLHVAANMHANPLVYGSEAVPSELDTMSLRDMLGRDEDSVTYPAFINMPDGRLAFIYRNGKSGNGSWFVNFLNVTIWQRAMTSALFASRWQNLPTSAYPSSFKMSADGYVHLAIVWRRTPDVSTNYAITYAKSRDLIHWSDHSGRAIKLPIDPGNSDLIDAPGVGKGLINNARVELTPSGSPLITYTRYESSGRNAVILASPFTSGWRLSTIAVASRRTLMHGGGTVPVAPTFGDPSFNNRLEEGTISVVFPGERQQRIRFNANTLSVVASSYVEKPNDSTEVEAVTPPVGLADVRRLLRPVRVLKGDSRKSPGSILYFTQGINRDQPRQCTEQEPKACDPPPSPLIFIPSYDG